MTTDQQTQYQSYLLRLWRSNPHSPWHGSLQSTANGERQTFATLADLVARLQIHNVQSPNSQRSG